MKFHLPTFSRILVGLMMMGEASLSEVTGSVSPQSPGLGSPAIIDSLSDADVKGALDLLKSNYLNPDAFSESEIRRATLSGLMTRLPSGASSLLTQTTGTVAVIPFYSEILEEHIGYLRLGSFSKSQIEEMDGTLKKFSAQSLKFLVLDLRATPPSVDFSLAAEIAKRFCPKGELLFSVKKPGAPLELIFTSNRNPQFEGMLVVLVDHETAGAPEVVAAVLRMQTKAMMIGEATLGLGVDYVDYPLHEGRILRVAESMVLLPGKKSIFPKGITPDLVVKLPVIEKNEIIKQSLEKGVSLFVVDKERPKMNEAALVAGVNPEIDAYELIQGKRSEAKLELRDTVLQRAVDFITTIEFYGTGIK